MQTIQQILLNNSGQRLTPELVNGMYHGIKAEVDKIVAAEVKKAVAAAQPAAAGQSEGE